MALPKREAVILIISADYSVMRKMAACGQIENCEMDGPLDLFLACDKKSVEIKGVQTPVNGEADILLFPTLEACNPFYKGLMLFANGELAGLIQGTLKPVVVMSRSESRKFKIFLYSAVMHDGVINNCSNQFEKEPNYDKPTDSGN